MEYSKDIILGINYLGEDKQLKKKGRIVKLINDHNFIVSMGITCVILIMLDCFLVYSFIELFQKI